ncbi:hypothetical protein MRX96_038895 [Rhipicephalus microplus]
MPCLRHFGRTFHTVLLKRMSVKLKKLTDAGHLEPLLISVAGSLLKKVRHHPQNGEAIAPCKQKRTIPRQLCSASLPPVPVGAGQDGPQGSLPKATAVAMRGGRRTMADVSRSLPALAQPPATASPSHPAAPLTASHQAAAADLGQATPEVGTWEVANFLQAAWTTAAGTDGCVFYEFEEVQQIKEQLLTLLMMNNEYC